MEDEIANLIGYWDWENKTANQCAAAVLSLINSQRCEWEHDIEGDWRTGCKAWFAYDYSTEDSFCPCCGKRIEVKDGQG